MPVPPRSRRRRSVPDGPTVDRTAPAARPRPGAARRGAALALGATLLLAGCSGDDGAPAGAADATQETPDDRGVDGEVVMPEATADLDTKPVLTVHDGPRPTTTQVLDVVVGDGPVAGPGDLVTVQYVGVLAADGQQFDASWDRGQPFPFQLGAGDVIAGWDEGVEGMAVGGRRILYIPADEAYGASGGGPIPEDADLVFVVDLLDVAEPVTKADEPQVELPDAAPDDLVVDDLVVGDGEEVVEGSLVDVHYVGVALSDGEVFDSSYDTGRPLTFRAGAGQLIPGFDEGMLGARVGGRRRLVIPPELAYGDEGAGEAIAPGETLVFVVDVVGVG